MPRIKPAAATAAVVHICLFSALMMLGSVVKAALLIVNSPDSIAGTYAVGAAQFGPAVPRPSLTAEAVIALDAAGSATDACGPISNAAAIAGRIAIVNRSICTFVTKARNVQQAGAAAMLVVNNAPGPAIGMGSDGTEVVNPITIPSLMVSQADGNLIKNQLANGISVRVSMLPGIVLSSIVVTPAGPTIVTGQTQQFIATGTFNDGSVEVLSNDIPASFLTQTGNGHNCAILADATVHCWGGGASGRLGNGTTTDSPTPVPVTGLTGVHSVSAGVNHTCAVAGGMGHCWGDNEFGQLGDGTQQAALTPVAVSGLTGALSISAGGAHTCAKLGDGTIKCWGRNTSGQLGIGSNADSAVPVAVKGLSGVVSVGAGNAYTCALMSDSTVFCWGLNFHGQLGNGTNDDSATPVAVPGLSGVEAVVASGLSHTCALMSDGTVRCWGRNDFGQLGDGTTANASTPITVPGVSGATAVSTGWSHTCALLSDGSVVCWGRNNQGQLGDGTRVDSTAPVLVNGLANVQAVAAGLDHTCALITDGTVRCWGFNQVGEIGDGTTGSHVLVPSTVVGIGPTLTWKTGAEQVASIDSNGLARGLTAGIALISATAANNTGATNLTVGPPGTTLPGTGVVVQPIDPVTQTSPVTVTYDSVTGTGSTTVTTSSTGTPPPAGLKLGNPPTYYEISTTAGVSGAITICINYSGISYGNEKTLKLMHNVGGNWVDVTTSRNPDTDTICGVVQSLSPFAIFEIDPYPFSGFFAPVANAPAVNTVKAGAAVPVKFSLSGNKGLNILRPGYPLARQITCSAGAIGEALPEAETSSQTGLRYDETNDQYVYVWKTDSSWNGSCWQFDLGLRDESERFIVVRFASK